MKSNFDFLILHLNFVLFAFLGFLARAGIGLLGAYQGPLNGVLWANFVGCVWMGFINKHSFFIPQPSSSPESSTSSSYSSLSNNRNNNNNNNNNSSNIINDNNNENPNYEPEYISVTNNNNNNNDKPSQNDNDNNNNNQFIKKLYPHLPHKSKTDIPMYVAVTTGFAGSFTTFSSFILETFQFSANLQPSPASLRKHESTTTTTTSTTSTSTGKVEYISKFPYPNPGWGVPMGFAYIICTMCLSLAGYTFGRHIAIGLERGFSVSSFISRKELSTQTGTTTPGTGAGTAPTWGNNNNNNDSSAPSKNLWNNFVNRLKHGIYKGIPYEWIMFCEWFCSIIAILSYLAITGLFIVSNIHSITNNNNNTNNNNHNKNTHINSNYRYWTFSLMISPIAVYIRYWISRWFNTLPGWKGKFPLGTFICNLSATIILAILVILQRGGNIAGNNNNGIRKGHIQCDVIRAFQDGFCGTLSTISTFISELYSLNSMFL